MANTDVNRKWASGLGQDGNPVYAPAHAIEVNGLKVYNPKDKHYAASGRYMEVKPAPPSEPAQEGYHYEARGWEIAEGEVRRVYAEVENPPPPPRVFVTADLVEALEEEGLWEQAKAWIVQQGKLDLVYTTAEFDENNENFKAGRAALQSALGWTDAQVEKLLAKCVKEGY